MSEVFVPSARFAISPDGRKAAIRAYDGDSWFLALFDSVKGTHVSSLPGDWIYFVPAVERDLAGEEVKRAADSLEECASMFEHIRRHMLPEVSEPGHGEPGVERLENRIHQLENGLRWIRFWAGLHYLGDAFDPEHMRDIVNVAADVLDGALKEKLPDFDEALARAKEAGKQWADRVGQWVEEDEASQSER